MASFCCALVCLSGPALAQTQKPIRIIVPFAPGASADGIARAIANDLACGSAGRSWSRTRRRRRLARAGPLSKAPPDGDTLGIGATGALLINPNLPKLDRARSAARARAGREADRGRRRGGGKSADRAEGVKELVERCKTNPDGVTYGSTGVNTGQHISMELLAHATGAKLVHMPYRGSAPAVVDPIAGQIPVVWVDITSAYPHIEAGALVAIGLGELKRSRRAGNPDHRGRRRPGFGRPGGFIGLFAPTARRRR